MKALLIIETMPSNCMECKYCGWSARDEEKRACMLLEGWFLNGEDIEENRSVLCPLKPMPKSMPYEQTDTQTVKAVKIDNGFRLGWNACLRRIEE